MLIDILQKKWLEWVKGKWVDEFFGVLWVSRKTLRTIIWETLFSLVHETEAIISLEIQERTLCYDISQEDNNDIQREGFLLV